MTVTIEQLIQKHKQFKTDSEEKIKAFKETNHYNKFLSDESSREWLDKKWINKNFEKIRKAYALIKFVRDLYNHEFIEMMKQFASEKGFETEKNIFEFYNNDIIFAVSYGLSQPMFYDGLLEHRIACLGFSKHEKIPDGVSIKTAIALLFKAKLYDDLNLDISVYDWHTVDSCISSLARFSED